MKFFRIIVLLFGIVLMTGVLPAPSFAANVALTKPANNLGLVGYWPMNEGTTTATGDFSGNGFNGTLSGSTKPTWVNGIFGKALSFNGTTASVATGDINQTEGVQKMTITLWLKPTAFSDGVQYVSKFNATNGWTLGSGGSGDGTFSNTRGLVFYPNAASSNRAGVNSSLLTAGVWTYVTVVYDSTLSDTGLASLKIYINGVAQTVTKSGTITGGTTGSNSAVVTLGSEPPTVSDALYNGVMDDVRIYNRALSASEVLALYARGTSGAVRANASSAALTDGTTLATGLLGLWTFDGGDVRWTSQTAGFALDRSGNLKHGTLTSMDRTVTPAIGKLGQALLFDGTNDSVTAGNVGSVQSVAFWVQPNSTTQSFIDLNGTATIDASGGTVRGNSITSPTIYVDGVVSSTLPDTGWHHIVVTTGSAVTASAFVMGKISSSVLYGRLDDVRIYNRVLSATEVTQLYQLGKAKVKP